MNRKGIIADKRRDRMLKGEGLKNLLNEIRNIVNKMEIV